MEADQRDASRVASEGRGGAAAHKGRGDTPACRQDGEPKDVHLLQEVLLPPAGAFLSVPWWTLRNMFVETEQTDMLRRPSCRTIRRARRRVKVLLCHRHDGRSWKIPPASTVSNCSGHLFGSFVFTEDRVFMGAA